jgi:ATP-dependent Lon protease
MVLPLFVGRDKSIQAIEKAQRRGGEILLITQKRPNIKNPRSKDLNCVGTVARINQVNQLPDGNIKIMVEGIRRARILQIETEQPFFVATTAPVENPPSLITKEEALVRESVLRNLSAFFKIIGQKPDRSFKTIQLITDPNKLADVIAPQLPLSIPDRQEILELTPAVKRLEKISAFVMAEIEIAKVDQRIRSRVQEQIEKAQKQHFLNEQLAAIHKELGEAGDIRHEAQDLEDQLKKKKMPDTAKKKVLKEIKRYKTLNGHSPEVAMLRHYIDLALELPWHAYSKDRSDIKAAEKILNDEHHALKDVKERILEFLAVRARVKDHQSPVICFSGPPGVGKTSLARSIAHSLDRKFERISLGGLRDEAELKGHRKTYIGALPGKILSAIRKAGTSNPVILLDEIDKMGMDFRGDPASALLEILDPEQNKHFTDHYLDLEYDLSKVLFIATANDMAPLSPPLRDRMEVIKLSGYTEDEKVAIAKQYIVPRELKNHGLKDHGVEINDRVLRFIIRSYTRESGVRGLQKQIAKLCRICVRKLTESEDAVHNMTQKVVQNFLGMPKQKENQLEDKNEVGLVSGLAWTSVGGEVLFVEANVTPGKGQSILTGSLGDVMKESVKAALTYVRAKAPGYQIPDDYFGKHDFHIHFPEGAIPKDGPSAGITIATAILSSILQIPVKRDVGMTGEITLRGRVLPIGGLKEKILAAKRLGLNEILYPKRNEFDLKDLDSSITQGLKIMAVDHMDEVIEKALEEVPVWTAAQNLRPAFTNTQPVIQ